MRVLHKYFVMSLYFGKNTYTKAFEKLRNGLLNDKVYAIRPVTKFIFLIRVFEVLNHIKYPFQIESPKN